MAERAKSRLRLLGAWTTPTVVEIRIGLGINGPGGPRYDPETTVLYPSLTPKKAKRLS